MNHATNSAPLSDEHARMLATHWWTGDEFRDHGVSYREGPYTPEENERVQHAIQQYQTISKLGQEDIEDIVLGTVKCEGFWETITRAVPGRRVASIRAHAQRLYEPYRDKGSWTAAEDLRLIALVNSDQHLGWVKISNGMQRPASACRNRYQRHLAHRDTRRRGPWSSEEEARLNQVMRDLAERDRTSNTSKFWKEVSELLGRTRTPDQCRSKWCDSLSPEAKSNRRVRWREADSKTLIKKVASLNLDTDEDVRWHELVDEEWGTWTADKLRTRWGALKAKVGASETHSDVVEQLKRLFSIDRRSTP